MAEDIFTDEDMEHAIHWSKATPRQRAIIAARDALGVKPDGYLFWFWCSFCQEKWGIKRRDYDLAPSYCPGCNALGAVNSNGDYPLYFVEAD
jgi:hypothetical protein